MMSKKTFIASAHPGSGKTCLSDVRPDLTTYDVEPVDYKWIDRKNQILNPTWPENCLEVIRQSHGQVDVILISTYPELIGALVSEGYTVTLVYPNESQKEEYKLRYVRRGNPQDFIDLMMKHFEEFIKIARSLQGCRHIVLEPTKYLSDVIDQIVKS